MAETEKIVATLKELVEAEPALLRVLRVKLEPKLRYHALKLAKLVAVETKHYGEEINALIKELGEERDPNGAERAKYGPEPIWEVTKANKKVFVERAKELQDVSATIAWGPITSAMVELNTEIVGSDLNEMGPLYELEPVAVEAGAGKS